MVYRVFRSKQCDKKVKKLDKVDKKQVENFEQELKQKPYSGDPLGYKFFREKKFNGKRLYFLVYEEHKIVFLVTISGKKSQQQMIDMIKANLDVYKDVIDDLAESL